MKEFLTEYINDILDAKGMTLSQETITEIVNILMNEDELWDTIDSYVLYELERKGVE